MKKWTQTTPRYDDYSDFVELVDEEGDVVLQMSRVQVLHLLSMFPLKRKEPGEMMQ